MADGEDGREEFISLGPVEKKVRKRRKDGWTRRDIQNFLAHYRVTGNITTSTAAAGKHVGSFYGLRDRDPVFAADAERARGESLLRLQSKAIVYAETGGKLPPRGEDGEPVEAPMDMFDPEYALKVLALERNRREGRLTRCGPRPRSASKEELVQAVMKLLGMLKRRCANPA